MTAGAVSKIDLSAELVNEGNLKSSSFGFDFEETRSVTHFVNAFVAGGLGGVW